MSHSLFIHKFLEYLNHVFKKGDLKNGLISFLAITRGLLFLEKQAEFFSLPLIRQYFSTSGDIDSMFYIRHRHYLCRGLNFSERISSAFLHYSYEDNKYNRKYKELSYRDGGLILWSDKIDGILYEILLSGTKENRHEGGIRITLRMERELILNVFSYAWMNAALINAGSGVVPFITCNQSMRHDSTAILMFRTIFPQQSPHYFCLAAMVGVALANGFKKIAAVKHDRQIAYKKEYEKSFLHSYTDLWSKFGASDIGEKAYLMNCPLTLRHLENVPSNHRKRAAMRRKQWNTISESTISTLTPYIRK